MSVSPPKRLALFIDRNSGGRTFRKLIEDQGIHVTLHDDLFSQLTAHDEWLKGVADKNLITITGDKRISRSPLFLQRLEKSRARVFILVGLNGGTRQEKAQCVIRYYERIVSLCLDRDGPLLFKINKDGLCKEIDFRKHLKQKRRPKN